MKRNYEKPCVFYERFTLSTQIAACANGATFDMNGCPVALDELGGATIFLSNGTCDWYAPDLNDMICYHVPTDDMSVFSS